MNHLIHVVVITNGSRPPKLCGGLLPELVASWLGTWKIDQDWQTVSVSTMNRII